MVGFIEDQFDDYDLDFLEEDFRQQNELADCVLSDSELQEFLAPATEVWRDYLPHSNEAVITFDTSKELNWKHAKTEIEHLHKSMKKLLKVSSVNDVNLEKIVLLVFGPSSKFARFMCEELDISEDEFLQFMETVCVQSAYGISVTKMMHPSSLLKRCITMEKSRYIEIWEAMSQKKRINRSQMTTGRRETPLWETFERLANELFRSISVSGKEGRIPVALDDDKIWLNISNSQATDLFGLKYTTHVKPNRKGIVGHTAVTTSLNVPIGIVFERVRDTTLTCFQRCLGFLFGQDGSVNLRNVSVHSDRGYMIPSLVFEFLISAGAEVVGTVKRMAHCWPYTYEQTLNENDNRTKIDPKGAATLFLKFCKAGHKYVFASAFRNGSGRVATAISTMHTQHQWEGVVLDQDEHIRYKANRNSLKGDFFCRVEDLAEEQIADLAEEQIAETESLEEKNLLNQMMAEEIEPYTLRQGTADWHYMRKFSLTSSQAHKSFDLAFPDFKDDSSWQATARYLYGPEWRERLCVVEEEAEEVEEQEEEEDSALESIYSYINKMVREEDEDVVMVESLQFIKNYVGTPVPDDSSDDDSLFENEIRRVEFESEGTVVEDKDEAQRIVDNLNSAKRKKILNLLSEHVKNDHRKNPATKKDLVGWLMSPNKIRNFWFYKANALKEVAKLQGLDVGKGRKTIEQLREIVANPQMHQPQGETASSATRGNKNANLPPKEAAIQAILEKSFLPHQKGRAREYCTLGHRLELPILKNWMNVMSSDDAPVEGLKIKSAYSAGLAAKKGAKYIKDSIDFVIIVENDQGLQSWGFEAKGRVTARSAANEERNLHYFNNPHTAISSDDVYEDVANEGERFQVLQHALVYNFEKVVLAISDEQSTLIRSTIISFDDEIKKDFAKVLKDIKEFSLDWAYPTENVKCLTIPDEIVKIASDIPTINGSHTLHGTANIWHALSSVPKPFPSMLRLIPAVYAFWNSVKGGSDTTTKLMDDCVLRVPKRYLNTETAACARVISILFVLIHRLNQTFSAQDNSAYSSLTSFRKAASARFTYHVSLLKCREIFSEQLKKGRNQNNGNTTHPNQENIPPASSFATPARARRSNRNRQIDGVVPESINFGARLQTKTPLKLGPMAKNGTLAPELKAMMNECTGMPMKAYPLTYGKCAGANCDKKTAWYCAGCKRWLCMDRLSAKDSTKQYELYDVSVRGKEKTFYKMCFHQEHEAAWPKRYYCTSTAAPAPPSN